MSVASSSRKWRAKRNGGQLSEGLFDAAWMSENEAWGKYVHVLWLCLYEGRRSPDLPVVRRFAKISKYAYTVIADRVIAHTDSRHTQSNCIQSNCIQSNCTHTHIAGSAMVIVQSHAWPCLLNVQHR